MSTPERTIVITGASSGFGAAAVRAFADRGDRVWGTMRDAAGRNATKKAELEAYSPRITIAEMDVTSDASDAEGFAAILADGPIDILINNAGIIYIGMTEAYGSGQNLGVTGLCYPEFFLWESSDGCTDFGGNDLRRWHEANAPAWTGVAPLSVDATGGARIVT